MLPMGNRQILPAPAGTQYLPRSGRGNQPPGPREPTREHRRSCWGPAASTAAPSTPASCRPCSTPGGTPPTADLVVGTSAGARRARRCGRAPGGRPLAPTRPERRCRRPPRPVAATCRPAWTSPSRRDRPTAGRSTPGSGAGPSCAGAPRPGLLFAGLLPAGAWTPCAWRRGSTGSTAGAPGPSSPSGSVRVRVADGRFGSFGRDPSTPAWPRGRGLLGGAGPVRPRRPIDGAAQSTAACTPRPTPTSWPGSASTWSIVSARWRARTTGASPLAGATTPDSWTGRSAAVRPTVAESRRHHAPTPRPWPRWAPTPWRPAAEQAVGRGRSPSRARGRAPSALAAGRRLGCRRPRRPPGGASRRARRRRRATVGFRWATSPAPAAPTSSTVRTTRGSASS